MNGFFFSPSLLICLNDLLMWYSFPLLSSCSQGAVVEVWCRPATVTMTWAEWRTLMTRGLEMRTAGRVLETRSVLEFVSFWGSPVLKYISINDNLLQLLFLLTMLLAFTATLGLLKTERAKHWVCCEWKSCLPFDMLMNGWDVHRIMRLKLNL